MVDPKLTNYGSYFTQMFCRYIFDREAILEYIVTRKAAYQKDRKEWEKQKKVGRILKVLIPPSAPKQIVSVIVCEPSLKLWSSNGRLECGLLKAVLVYITKHK